MKIKAFIAIIIIGFVLAFAYHFIAIAAIDAPHNESYSVSCGTCHGQGLLNSPFWGGSMSFDSLCTNCHKVSSCPYVDTNVLAVEAHLDSDENALAECRTCHNPHYQKQKNYKNTDWNNLYLAYGTIESFNYNGDGTSTLTYSSITYKTGWDATGLTGKTEDCRRTILFPNVKKLGYSYPIIAVDTPAVNTITVKGDVTPVYQYITTSDFAVLYGQYIRDIVNDRTVKFFDKGGSNSYALDESATGIDPTPDGVCQVCHTDEANPDNPTHWRADGTGADHFNNDSRACTYCHTHVGGYLHGGGGGEGCADCHNSGNHVPHLDLELQCDDCHNMNNMPNFKDGLDLPNTTICAECHKNGAGGGPNQTDYKTEWGNEAYDLDCTGCHSKPPDYANGSPKANSHAAHNNYTCNNCHIDTTTDGDTITTLANHINNVYNVAPEGPVSFTYTFDSGGGTCDNISCHGDTDAQWGVLACLNCHSVSLGDRAAITGQFSTNSHHVQDVSLTGSHCYECHWEAGSDGSVNGTYHGGSASPGSVVDLVQYGDGTRPTTYTEGTTAILYTANGNRIQIKEINAHCLGCHSDLNNSTQPFGDGKTPKEYAWDNSSIDARYSQAGTTAWVRYGGDADVPIINESFERNPGYDEFSQVSKGSGATLDPDYTPIPAPPPPGAGSQCLKSAVVVSGGKQAYAGRDLGLEITKSITGFYLNVAAAQEFTGDSYKNIVRFKNSNATNVIRFRLYDNAGQLQFNLSIYNNGGWQDYYYPAAGAISFNTWYEIDITYDNINDAWEWKVNGATQPDPLFSNALTGTHRDGIQIWDIGFSGTGTGLTGNVYFDLVSVEGHNVGNFTPKNVQIKAYSAHGNATGNQGGWDLNETWPDTRKGSEDIACFDCHNSHGSNVSGNTTSYTSTTTNGGILKDTEAGKGGYSMGYEPQEGGSTEDKNAYNAGAGLCFDCHMNANAGTTPWGYQGTFGATQAVMGYRDTPYFGDSTGGPQQRFPYKALTLPGVPRAKGGHFGASSGLTSTPAETIGGLCTPCHDPHGVSATLDQEYAIPLLKGTWITSFYKEDRAPANNVVGTLRTDRGREGVPYNIDQNTFGTDIGGTGIFVGETDSQFAGLCLRCHPKDDLTDGTNGGTWESIDRVHESVKGWGANVKHNYTCSKCHGPHNARLPRLMVTNCLDRRLKGRVGDNLAPILSGVGYGCSCCDNRLYMCEDTRCADGPYPFDGCPSTNGNIVCYDEAQELGYCPDVPKTHVIDLKGQGSGSFPGKWVGGWNGSPSSYGNYNSVTCHENEAADQSWNAVTEWYTDRPVILYPPGITAGTPTAVGADIQVTIHWTTDIASTSYVDYGLTDTYGDTAGDVTLVTDHSVTITGLANYSIHHYKVRSAGPLGTEVESGDNILEYISLPPSDPILHDELDNSCAVTCTVTLEWDEAINPGSGGDVEYRIQVKKETTSWTSPEHDTSWISEAVASCDGSTCSWDITIRPDLGTTWNWRVRARDTDPPRLTSSWSSVDSFTVTQPAGSPPLDPLIIAEPDVVSPASSDVTLQWYHVSYTDPVDYFVQVNSESDCSGTGANDHISDWIAEGTACSGGTCSWTLTLPTDTAWYWRVQARNSNDHGLISPWSTVDYFAIYPLLINESFEKNFIVDGTGYDETWAETIDTGCTLEPDSAVPGTPPAGAGLECLQSISVSPGYDAYATRDLGSVQTKTFTRFYVYVEAEGLGLSTYKDIGILEDDAGNDVIIFRLFKASGGNLKFRFQLYNNGSWTNYTSGAISLNTWYKIDIKYDNNNNTWEFRINGATQFSGSLTGTHYNGIQKWNLGFVPTQSRWGTIYFDLVTVNILTFY